MLVRLGHELIDSIAALLGCLVEREPRREMPHYSRCMSVARTTGNGGASKTLTPWKKVGQECAWNCGAADHVHGIFCVCDILRRLSARSGLRLRFQHVAACSAGLHSQHAALRAAFSQRPFGAHRLPHERAGFDGPVRRRGSLAPRATPPTEKPKARAAGVLKAPAGEAEGPVLKGPVGAVLTSGAR